MFDKNKKIKYKLKRFINQSRFLESEYDEINLLLDEYLELFNEEFKYELSLYRSKELDRIKKEKEELKKREEEQENDIKINIEHIDDDEDNNKDNNKDDNNIKENNEEIEENIYNILLKKIYRKLAMETHPDKINGKKSKLFNKIEEYYKDKKILDLLALAVDFDIDIIIEIEKIVNQLIQKVKNNDSCDIKKINKEYDNLLNDLFKFFEKNIKGKENEVENLKKSVGWVWYHASTDEEKNKVKNFLYNNWSITEEEVEEYKKNQPKYN